jgi:hypothetical protein
MKAAMSPKARPAIRQPMAAPATAPPEIPPEDPSEDDVEAAAELVSDVDAVDVISVDVSPVPLSVFSASVELVVGVLVAPGSDAFDVAVFAAVFVAVAASAVAIPITPVTVIILPDATSSRELIVVVVFPVT